MDELSWRAKLAKANINILNIRDDYIFLEFTYHPKPGTFKWCKTAFEMPKGEMVVPEEEPLNFYRKQITWGEISKQILTQVLELRKELEG